jgi:hypothetical protein
VSASFVGTVPRQAVALGLAALEPISLSDGLLTFDRTTVGVVGLFVRKLEFTYEPYKPPLHVQTGDLDWET